MSSRAHRPRLRRARWETQSVRPLNDGVQPEHILVIRLHAVGDIAVTIPCAVALRRRFPAAVLDFLTTRAGSELVGALHLYGRVWTVEDAGTRNVAGDIRVAARVRRERYALVVDIQRNRRTRFVRRLSGARWWTEFDRFSPLPAATRVERTFVSAGLPGCTPVHHLPFRDDVLESARALLRSRGWNAGTPLLVLNPAGLWDTRKWPVSSYIAAGRLFIERHAGMVLCLGTERIADAARTIAEELGDRSIVLVNQTSLALAFALVSLAAGMISDDSGLMHMAWAAGVPTVALFGSTDHRKSAPVGSHVAVLHSGDLPCGACAESRCRLGDVRCLTRHAPEAVVGRLESLLRIPGNTQSSRLRTTA